MSPSNGEFAVLSCTTGHCLSTLDSNTQAQLEGKFEMCFVMAKQSISFTNYLALQECEQRHEEDIGHAYNYNQ